jgi:TPR repeat protein
MVMFRCRVLLAVAALLVFCPPAVAGYDEARAAMARSDFGIALGEARKGAEAGDPRAQVLLGQMLLKGIGGKKDAKEAARWFRAAAEKGNATAQRELGGCYFGGDGVAKDPKEAAIWYRKAAEQKDAPAQLMLALLLLGGDGVAADEPQAAGWARTAAEGGFPPAQMLLAGLYRQGVGVQPDVVQAYVWMSLAASAKEPKAAGAKRDIAKEMSKEQVKEGDRLAKAWRPSEPKGSPQMAALAPAASAAAAPPAAERMRGTGTGFAVSAEGHVITNDHVVRSCKSVRVRHPDESLSPAKLLASARADDLALLKVDKVEAVAPFRSGRELRQGEQVVAFGFPLSGVLASSGNLTIGNVTALAGLRNDERFLQTSTPIQPGNSGGPLLDMNGRVVGVTTASISTLKASAATGGAVPQNVNFAIKGDVVAAFLEKHGVSVSTTGGSSRAIKPADVGDRAKRFTVRVECLG